jgi:hypothetical protein
MTLPSYSSPLAVGHRHLEKLFDGPVVVQEKVDGSQISFGLVDGALEMRSRGVMLNLADANGGMFNAAIAAVARVRDKLVPGYVYRGEYLAKPKHNTLAYDRVPLNHIALFDIEDTNAGSAYFLDPKTVATYAEILGFDVVPTYFEGVLEGPNDDGLSIDRVSFLGGQQIEGVVIKNYAHLTPDKKVTIGKIVSEKFKEVHRGAWRAANPTRGDVVESLIAGLSTPARFAKAVQHLREAGTLVNAPQDIGNLIVEVQADLKKECGDEIAGALVAHFMPKILRGVVRGVPDWYKAELAANATLDAAGADAGRVAGILLGLDSPAAENDNAEQPAAA